MTNRPRIAAFFLEIRLACHDARADVLALLSPMQVREALGRFKAVHGAVEPDTVLTLTDRFTWAPLPSYLSHLRGRACHGSPIDITPGSISKRRAATAKLMMSAGGVQWRVPATEAGCAFETTPILWGSLLEWGLMLAEGQHIAEAFRRLSAWNAYHALEVLKRNGTLLLHDGLGEPHRVAIPAEAISSLLTHRRDQIREMAMTLLGRTRTTV
jgi:hypothetical protein